MFYIVLLGILVLGVVYIYLHRQELGLASPGGDEGTSSEQAGSASSPARMYWQKIDRSPDGFKVEMPSDAREIQVPAYNEHGGSEQVNMLVCNPNDETTFSVAWADDPPVARVNSHAPDRTMDMARDDALARTQSTLINESRINLGGYPARDFMGRNTGGGIIDSRLIFAGQRLYMLSAAFPSSSARRGRDVTRFFNSFTVTSSAGMR